MKQEVGSTERRISAEFAVYQLWKLRFNFARQPAARSEGAGDFRPDGPAGCDDIVKDSVDGIFIEDAEIAVGMDIHFERFQLKAFFVGHIVQRNGSEVRQVGFGANRGVFGDLNRNFVSLILVRESLDVG